MEYRHPIIVRANDADMVRRWAELEGKSATMREDLYRRHALRHSQRYNSRALLGIFVELGAAVLDAWCHFHSR